MHEMLTILPDVRSVSLSCGGACSIHVVPCGRLIDDDRGLMPGVRGDVYGCSVSGILLALCTLLDIKPLRKHQ